MRYALRLFALVGVILFSYSISISSQSAIPVPGKIEVENYTGFYDLDPGNQGGACRTDDVDLYVTWDPPDGGCNLGHTKATEWLSFTINVSQANTYVLSARVAHPGRRRHLPCRGRRRGRHGSYDGAGHG